MSFLKNIFGSTETEKATSKLTWNHLEDMGQLDEICQNSEEKPVLIFKHSTTCSISRMAFKNFENEFEAFSKIEIYYLDLLNFRAISNEIASRFGVVHQSPQVILIKKGSAVYNTSHENIAASYFNNLV